MISVPQPLTSEMFRSELKDRLEYLFTDYPHPGFASRLGELNQLILFARADGATECRQFTGDELMDIEAKLVVLDMTRFSGSYPDYWRELMAKLQEMGLQSELVPEMPSRIS